MGTAIESSGGTMAAGTWTVPSNWAYKVYPDGTVENTMGVEQSTGVTGAAANINWAASRGKTLMAEGTFNITSAITGVSHSLYGMGEGSSLTGPGRTILAVTSNLQLGTANGYDNGSTVSVIRLAASGTSAAPIVIGGFDIDGNMEMFETTYASFGGPLTRDHDHITFDHLYVHHMPKSHGIEFINAHHVQVTNCEIGHIGGYRTFTIAAGGTIFARPFGDGVAAGDGGLSGTSMCHDCLVENCWVHDCSMVAVNWEPGYNNVVRDCTLHASGTWWSIAQQKEVQAVAVTAYSMDDFSITTHNNSYLGCDISCPGGLAMKFGLSDDVFGPTDATTIDDCFIHDCANGIHIDGGTGHIISDTDVRTSGGACLTTANGPEITITNSTCNQGALAPPGDVIPIRWTWVDCPTEVQADTDNSYTARLEIWDQALNDGGGGWRTDHGMPIIFSFISLSGGTDHTLTCTTPTEGTASGECTVTFHPTATGPYAVRADWDHSSSAYSWTSSEIKTISVIDHEVIPIQWTWVQSPTALTVGQTYTYEAEVLIWDADLNAFRATSNTHVRYHFVSQTSGVPDHAIDCYTPQYPADLTGRCVIEFTPEHGGVWELYAEWDSTGMSGYSNEPSSGVTVTADPVSAGEVADSTGDDSSGDDSTGDGDPFTYLAIGTLISSAIVAIIVYFVLVGNRRRP